MKFVTTLLLLGITNSLPTFKDNQMIEIEENESIWNPIGEHRLEMWKWTH